MKKYQIGIDEVGRGPLAGPVCVCACAVGEGNRARVRRALRGIRDSKKLSPERREEFVKKIKKLEEENLLHYKLAFVSAKTIDKIGISGAIKRALNQILSRLKISPKSCKILLDGNLRAPEIYKNQKTIIGGDDREWLISTASVIAKVARDRKIITLARKYPAYGFEIHKGYGTKKHREAIRKFGLCAEHRRSFLKKLLP